MNRPPAFLLYVKDFLTSRKIAVMSLDQVGAYILLMAACWDSDDCSLPDDDQTLAVLSRMGERWSKDGRVVRACFVPHPKHTGHLTNERLFVEFKTLLKTRRDKRKAGHLGGVKSGRSRREAKENISEIELKQSFDSASSKTEAKRSSSISSSSSSSISKEREENILRKPKDLRGEEFKEFWLAYPRKAGKKEALRAWEKAKDLPSLEVILAALEQQRQSEQWTKDGGKFIPYPETWLNKGRWLDQPMPPSASQRCQSMLLKPGYPDAVKCLELPYHPKAEEKASERILCRGCYEKFWKADDERKREAQVRAGQRETMRAG